MKPIIEGWLFPSSRETLENLARIVVEKESENKVSREQSEDGHGDPRAHNNDTSIREFGAQEGAPGRHLRRRNKPLG